MPSIVPGYIYTFFAIVIVGTILTSTYTVLAFSIRPRVEEEQLKNLMEYVAAQSCEVISSTISHNSNATLRFNMPNSIGNQEYWIQLNNDSNSAWVAAGFGTGPSQPLFRAFIPSSMEVSGLYESIYSNVLLECEINRAYARLRISGE